MVLPIVHYNDPVLRQRGERVASFDPALSALVHDMLATMAAAHGIGLAAQQIGQARQLCVIDLSPTDRDFTWELDGQRAPLDLIMPMALVNPTIEFLPGDDYAYEEGCLSFPEIRGDVVRPDRIRVGFQDVAGVPHQLYCDGLFARCIQHEVDHLNGTLFIDRMSKSVRLSLDREIKDLARRTKERSG
jgi:peptide deformylase